MSQIPPNVVGFQGAVWIGPRSEVVEAAGDFLGPLAGGVGVQMEVGTRFARLAGGLSTFRWQRCRRVCGERHRR
jgi:hypothetical protein